MGRARKLLLLNLPGILAATAFLAFSTDLAVFRPLKTEATVGWWLVVLLPASELLLLIQLFLWSEAWRAARERRRAP